MPKKEDTYGSSETGNWNVASDFSRLKIMKQLYLSDNYANLSIFGSVDLPDENSPPLDIDRNKIDGFRRLVQCLIMIIDNTLFALKKMKTEMEEYKKELMRINNIINVLYEIKTNHVQKTRRLVLKKESYEEVLKRVLEIKSLINEPLNKADLIFTSHEDFDPKAAKDMIKDGLFTMG